MAEDGTAAAARPGKGADRGAAGPEGVRVWRIHLGAHKTATTHLQRALARARPALRAQGVRFVPLHKLRGAGLPDLLAGLTQARADADARRSALHAALRPLCGGAPVVALSEENLLGLSFHLLRHDPYPRAGTMARWLAQLGDDGAEVKLFLGIRSFDTLAPSAYAEATRRRRLPGGFAAVRLRLAVRPPSWVGLIDRLRAAAPKAELRVWRHEDHAAHARALATLFAGADPGPLDAQAPPAATRTPSAAAVAEAEALPRGLSKAQREARTAEIYARLPATGPETRFNPFTEAERRRLRARHARDLDRIAQRHPGVLVRFD